MPTALIADAGPQAQRLAAQALAEFGFTADVAADLEAALAALRARGCDLVLADRRLAGGGGAELARRLRHHPAWERIPVLLTLGAFDSPTPEESLAVVAALRKPLAAPQLGPVLARLFPGLAIARAAAPRAGAETPDAVLEKAVRAARGLR